jgi:hypothetical protein
MKVSALGESLSRPPSSTGGSFSSATKGFIPCDVLSAFALIESRTNAGGSLAVSGEPG